LRRQSAHRQLQAIGLLVQADPSQFQDQHRPVTGHLRQAGCSGALVLPFHEILPFAFQDRERRHAASHFVFPGFFSDREFVTLAITSLASGVLVTTRGWTWLNLGSLLPVALVAAGLGWLALRTVRPATA